MKGIGQAIASIGLTAAMATGIAAEGFEVSAQGPKQVPDNCSGKPVCILDKHILFPRAFQFADYYIPGLAERTGHLQHLFPNGDYTRRYWGFAAFPESNTVVQLPLQFLVTLQDNRQIYVEGTGIMGTSDTAVSIRNGFVGVIDRHNNLYVAGTDDCKRIEYVGVSEP